MKPPAAPVLLTAVSIAAACLAAGTAFARSLPDFTGLVEHNRAAVVNISTTQRRTAPSDRPRLPKGFEMPDLPENSPFREFFRRFFGEGEIEEFDTRSLGSGFVISQDGYIISNNHVVRDADEVIVRLSDRREYKAKVVGTDEPSDVALLKINAEGLPVVRLGIDYELKVGEWVLAIGSPFGFDHSVTAGIVSAKGRSLPRENYVPFIQTDVAINPGNSGGPLFNLHGEVGGGELPDIQAAPAGSWGCRSRSPIDVAMDVAEQLRDKGRVSRGWLGSPHPGRHPRARRVVRHGEARGARLVARVLDGSPAERAGFAVGDVLLSFDAHPIERSSDLPPIVGRTRVGREVEVEILRGGQSMTLMVTTDELPADDVQVAAARPPGEVEADRLGLVVRDLSDEERASLDVADHGVLVGRVADGPAKRAGIREGDVILMLNNEKVSSSGDLERLVAGLPEGKAASVLIQRQGSPIFLALKPE